MIGRVLLVARNAFRAIMSKRAVYIWGAAILLMFFRSAPAIFLQSDDARMIAFRRANAIGGALELWSTLCIASAIFLGAAAIASEMTSKTIVTLLARPIRRVEVMVGKWIGVTAFSLVSLAIGVALDMAIARYLNIDVDRRALVYALAQTVVAVALYGAVAVALSGSGSAIIAVAFTILLIALPGLVNTLKEDPGRTQHRIGVVLDYLLPPGYQSHYSEIAWAPFPSRDPRIVRPRPVFDPKGQHPVLLKNMGYAAVYFAIGCFFFSRRDIKLS